MKQFFTLLLLFVGAGAIAQPFNNEWIDYSKTYYKFKVGANGVCRIPQATLAAVGLGSVPAEQFQLFRNGQEVPVFVTNGTGIMGASDYLEFWGQMNDGVPDKPLYRSPTYQHTPQWSLETDTAVYFLTINPAGTALRIASKPNNAASSPLTPETYFMHTVGTYYKARMNPGFAQVVGEYIYSSSYDIGEVWASYQFGPNLAGTDNKTLPVYTGGPNASIKVGMVGCADNPRTMQVTENGTVVVDTTMNSFNDAVVTRSFPLSLISGGTSAIGYNDNCATTTDRVVISFYELNYPRKFDAGGQANFPFQLPAKAAGYLFNFTNIGASPGIPVLYDLTNDWRYTGVGSGSNYSFALNGSAANMNLVLVNEDPASIQTVTSLTPKTFTNFGNSGNQGNYILIGNPLVYTGSSGNNPVIDYKNYRSSLAGGGFDAQVYDINELVDQFAFGIKKHPLSIQNFLRYARARFAAKPQYVLLIGHGMTYDLYNQYSEVNHDPLAGVLNMIPTFGFPASDNMLSADNGIGSTPVTPIGRLSVINGTEVETYLTKVKEYEQAQATAPNTIAGRLWMKNVVHLTGVSEPYLGTILCNYMNYYGSIIADTLAGASVSTFCDGNASQVSQVPGNVISGLFSQGIGVLSYFGHSANNVLGYNLNDPYDYTNQGKYPVFLINGCDAGNFYVWDPTRLQASNTTISENFVLAKERGAIAFVASTNFGIVNYLNILLNGQYQLMAGSDYGKPLGILEKDALQGLINAVPGDYFARLHAEQMTLHGDPYIKLNQEPTDYDIEASQVLVNPGFVSVSSNVFSVNAKIYNLGKAVSDSVLVTVQRTYPDGSKTILLSKKIRGIRYVDSVQLTVPIIATRDKGDNKITISVNPDQHIPEVTYANNTVTVDVFVYQDGATPVYPANYSIINTPTSKLSASTANPLVPVQQYVMEIDTTANFNSPLKVDKLLTSPGGLLEFDPGISFMDSVVYYWRVSNVPLTGGQYTWAMSSFVYIDPARSGPGFNQSHYFQHQASIGNSISINTARNWAFNGVNHDVYQRNAVFPVSGQYDIDFSVSVDGQQNIQSACVGYSLIFNVFDPVTMHPWKNVDANGNNLYLSGSAAANCAANRNYNFEFSFLDTASRHKMVRFMDSIPNGFWVTVKNIPADNPAANKYAAEWHRDTAYYGHGNSIYDRLYNAGLTQIDSFDAPRVFLFIYKKNDASFVPAQKWSKNDSDAITLESTCPAPSYSGSVVSPVIGPVRQWSTVHWRGADATSPVTDTVGIQVVGIDTLGNSQTLFNLARGVQDLDISSVDAKRFPYLKLQMSTYDSIHGIPYQLKYWRINYSPAPEGAIAPNILFKAADTVIQGQPLEVAVAFKNVSPINFDSLKLKLYITDKSNVQHSFALPRRKPLVSGDTVTLDYLIDTKGLVGTNTLYIGFNPDNDQPEQYLFNNFMYKTVVVRSDTRSSTLDVTFDNVHILNEDIVSARPHIQIRLKSLSSYLLLTDTSLVSVKVKYPDGSIHPYTFSNDTLRFTPATAANNNIALVDFMPAFLHQYNPSGDEYTLIVTGKDALGDPAGATGYRVSFKVISKPMISNMLNYPNPFTTSTAFVFTITGVVVPQNIKIQIMTITGKVVREITKDELGPLHIGRNITEFKWNGTDMYGQRLANGVYLYHVVTNLDGHSLDKYKSAGDNTDKFFNNGYGKMYLMK